MYTDNLTIPIVLQLSLQVLEFDSTALLPLPLLDLALSSQHKLCSQSGRVLSQFLHLNQHLLECSSCITLIFILL